MEAKTEMASQPESEQTAPEAASIPQAETEESEEAIAGAASAEDGPTEARHRQPENEVAEVEIPNVGKILVVSEADGYNEEVQALMNYKDWLDLEWQSKT